MTVEKVKYFIDSDKTSEAIFTYSFDGKASLSVVSDDFSVTKIGDDIFDCFEQVRNELLDVTFICFGAHKYCYPSGMCRSMGDGLLVYYHVMGVRPDRSSIRKIFDFDEGEDPSLCVPVSLKQKEYLEKWFDSF